MPAEPQNPALVECRRPDGTIFARLRLWPTRDAGLTGEAHPLIRWSEAEAHARGEEAVQLRERPVAYGSFALPERDSFDTDDRALPPAEHHVIVAWYETPAQLDWTKREGLANIRLGARPGTWHIPPEVSSARHLLLRTHGGVVVPGLFRLQAPGYRVFTANDLLARGYPGTARGEIYAVFEVSEDPAYAGFEWNGKKLMDVLAEFEAQKQQKAAVPLGRTSPYPRVLSLLELLKALK